MTAPISRPCGCCWLVEENRVLREQLRRPHLPLNKRPIALKTIVTETKGGASNGVLPTDARTTCARRRLQSLTII
jgi:hypothetical protein